jgi:hypothetical protein
VDYFIRPPIKITFTFEQPIWISHIKFGTAVGSQKSRGFDIQLPTSSGQKFIFNFFIINNKLILFFSDPIRVTRVFVQDPNNTEEIILQNFAFPGNKFCKKEQQQNYRLGQTKYLECVKSLEIRIFATYQSSIPCLSNVQIWGKVASNVNREAKSDLFSKWTALLKARRQPQTSDPIVNSESDVTEIINDAKNEDTNGIPSVFLDALTCKRMDVPMILPCGQWVDRSSLDTYNSHEAKWGRPANDPFTGNIFFNIFGHEHNIVDYSNCTMQ